MSELRVGNRVRMIFNVFNISDISKVDGNIFDTRFLNNKIRVTQINPYIWPSKHRVTSVDCDIWRKNIVVDITII